MTFDFNQLPHKGIQDLIPYQAGKSVEELRQTFNLNHVIKLASNENPLGCSPKALAALRQIENERISYYPAPDYHPLKPTLSNKLSLNPNKITLSAGSDTLFSLLMTAFALDRNKYIVTHDKAFMTFSIQAKVLNIPLKITPLKANWEVDIDALISACDRHAALIFIANPNNPTGLLIPMHEIERLLATIPTQTIVVLDEAYYEFSCHEQAFSSLSLLEKYPNLVITRTFSKAYGLAGLRLGFSISHPDIAEIIHRIQLPFLVNQAALVAGLAALDDEDFLQKTLLITETGRKQLEQGFDQLALPYLPSSGNFVMVDCQQNAATIFQMLQTQGIIVRPLQPYGLPNHLRISVGKETDNALFLKAFKEALTPKQKENHHVI